MTEEQKKKEEQLHEDVKLRFALPPNWAPYTDQNSGQVYYYNSVTGQSQWQRPMYSSEEIERIKAEKEKRELQEELLRKESNEKINEKIALANQKAKGIPLTREQKQKEMKEEEERIRKMIEDSKEEEKKLLLNFDPKNPFGEWKEETSSSYIYEHSEELKKKDSTKAQKEKFDFFIFYILFIFFLLYYFIYFRERLQKLQNNSSSSSSSLSSSLSTTNEEEDELEEAEESLNSSNREERGGIGMGIGSRYEQRLISQLPSVLRTIGEASTEEKAEKEEKKKNFIASLVEKKREEDERKEEEGFVKTLKGEEEDIKDIKEELEEKEENRDNDKKENVNKQTPSANKKISFSLKKKG